MIASELVDLAARAAQQRARGRGGEILAARRRQLALAGRAVDRAVLDRRGKGAGVVARTLAGRVRGKGSEEAGVEFCAGVAVIVGAGVGFPATGLSLPSL